MRAGFEFFFCHPNWPWMAVFLGYPRLVRRDSVFNRFHDLKIGHLHLIKLNPKCRLVSSLWVVHRLPQHVKNVVRWQLLLGQRHTRFGQNNERITKQEKNNECWFLHTNWSMAGSKNIQYHKKLSAGLEREYQPMAVNNKTLGAGSQLWHNSTIPLEAPPILKD